MTRRRAFTLLEVLIALLLMAVLLPVLMRAMSLAARLGAYGSRQTQARTLAEQQLATILADGTYTTGDADGTFDVDTFGSDAERYSWTLEVDSWDDTSARHLTMRVTWLERSGEQSVELATVAPAELP